MVHPDSQELDRERSPVPEGYTPYTYEFRDRHGKMQRERLFLKNTPIITESEVEQARIEPERRECLHITLNTQGGKTMKAATSAMNLGRDRLALVVQGKIKSAPVVQAVISRTFEISGLDGKNEASGLAELLNRQAPTEKNTPFIPQDLALYAVHPESRRLVEEGRELPVDVRNAAIFHAGPIIRPLENDKFEMVSVGPTTSMRMEKFEKEFVEQTGVKVIIGKGGMGPNTEYACKNFKAIHCVFPAGNAVVAAMEVEEIVDAQWRDLGMPETLWHCRVKEFGPLIVSIDTEGRNLFEENKVLFNERKDKAIEEICKHVGFIK